MERVVLFGNGSVASVVHCFLAHDSPYEVAAFTVDREYIKEDTLSGLPVVPFADVESVYPPDEYKMLVAVGYTGVNRLRAERYYQAKAMGYQLISYISSRATTWPGLVIGENCVVGANSVIQPFVEIGDNVIISSSCTIGHHAAIKEHCFLASGVAVAGGVTLEPYAFLGTSAIIRNRITVARESVIGAGAVILEDTQERGVYIARPADLLPIPSDRLLLR
jgi:sugar O-acyltransferase (sialic acid O-acetyltransferase NeuD family)